MIRLFQYSHTFLYISSIQLLVWAPCGCFSHVFHYLPSHPLYAGFSDLLHLRMVELMRKHLTWNEEKGTAQSTCRVRWHALVEGLFSTEERRGLSK